jgi:hypothetical protein
VRLWRLPLLPAVPSVRMGVFSGALKVIVGVGTPTSRGFAAVFDARYAACATRSAHVPKFRRRRVSNAVARAADRHVVAAYVPSTTPPSVSVSRAKAMRVG